MQSTITEPQVLKIEKQNNFMIPTLKMDYDARIIYFNSSAMPILKYWNCLTTRKMPAYVLKGCPEIFDNKAKSYYDISVKFNNHLLHFFVVPFPEAGYIGLYGDFTPKETSN